VSRRERIAKQLLVEPGTDANLTGEQARLANAEARRRLEAQP
jgi:hypothetical protein